MILELFMITIKRIWINNPENNMFGLDKLLAKGFSEASLRLGNFNNILNDIEIKIAKEKLMRIYSKILIHEYEVKEMFRTHMKEYITNYDKFTPMYIHYLMSTYPYLNSRIDILTNYLIDEGENYAVKYSDFVNYPKKVVERIMLFTNLINLDIIPTFFGDSAYYKNSVNAKNYIAQNTFKDALIIYSNIIVISQLLETFFLYEGEDPYNVSMLMINFQEKVDKAKNYYNSLKTVQEFWSKFFPNEKKAELVNLNNKIKKFEEKKLENCMDGEELDNEFKKNLSEAEKGKQLQSSIIFMEIFNKLNDLKYKEKERYQLSLQKFGELRKLGDNSDLNSLDNEVKEDIIIAISKNMDALKSELDFIKNYFNFGYNNNFDMKKIEENILNLVKIHKMKTTAYVFNLEEKSTPNEEEKK